MTFKKATTTKFGAHAYQNEIVTLFHITWLNHARVMRAAAPKLALIFDMTARVLINEKGHVTTFAKPNL